MLFLLVSSEEDAGTALPVLKKIALLRGEPEFYREACAAGDPGKVHKVLRSFEEILDSHGA